MKKTLILISVLIGVMVAAFFLVAAATPVPVAEQSAGVFPLEYTSLADNVDVSGILQSQATTKVYSALPYPVFNLAVQEGDVVSEGDLLCQLDTEALELSIQQQSSSINSAQSKADYNLAIAKNDLETAEFNQKENYNTAVISADTAVKNAEAVVKNAEIALHSANNDLFVARKNLREERDNEDYYPDEDSYDKAISSLRSIVSAKEIAVEAAQQALENAQQGVENAEEAREAVGMAAKEQLETYRQRVRTAELASNFSDQWLGVQKLQLDLEKATVTAPVSGVITAVNVTEGAPGSGQLFIIESTDNLEVVSNVGEHDIIHVRTGATVGIKPDADETALYNGVVTYIAPAPAITTTGGATAYETKAAVTSGTGNLRIGMHVSMNITTAQREHVFAVPYASITKNAQGESIVLVARPSDDGGYVAMEIPVTRGLETELLVEIYSEQLSEGDLVLSSVQGIHAGYPINPLIN